jgi:hypothetical protein
MRRDRRLAAAIVLFVLSAVGAGYQVVVVRLFMTAAVMGQWDHFVRTFSVELPYRPNAACFDYCAPDVPFMAGWLAIAGSALGLGLVAHAWWRPKA